jgi:hypothetical protein
MQVQNQYEEKSLIVLAFPSQQFLNQKSKDEAIIKNKDIIKEKSEFSCFWFGEAYPMLIKQIAFIVLLLNGGIFFLLNHDFFSRH